MNEFNDVNDLVNYLNEVTNEFVVDELSEFFTDVLKQYAMQEVYDRDGWKPKVYIRQYTLADEDFYESTVSKPAISVNTYEQTIYTYSTSPHADIVVNGEPYDFDFRFNGVPRMFATMADAVLRSNKGDEWLKHQYKYHLESHGFETE